MDSLPHDLRVGVFAFQATGINLLLHVAYFMNSTSPPINPFNPSSRRIFYQRVVIQIVGMTVSSLRQEAHQEDILHDNTTFVLPIEPPRDIICPQHNPSSVPGLISSSPAFQLHNQDARVLRVDCRRKIMPRMTRG